MNHRLTIAAHNKHAVLERLLRVTRHRGFHVTAMNMQSDEERLTIVVDVESERPITLLSKQLNKLIDIAAVSYEETSAMQCRA